MSRLAAARRPRPNATGDGGDAGQASRRARRLDSVTLVLFAILVLALAFRLKGIAYGLPFSFVNADESTVVPKAAAAARAHLNPQFFFYPSLYFYLAGALYVLAAPVWWLAGHGNLLSLTSFVVDPGPYFLLARLLSAAMGTASVYLVYRLGRDAFGRPAALVAALFLAVAPLHVAYSHMAVTDVTAVAFSLLALVLLARAAGARAARLGARRRVAGLLVAGAVAAGLAMSTKYNLGMLVVPATVAGCFACREEAADRVAAGGRTVIVWLRLLVLRVYVPMAAAFVLASPFIVLDAPHFLRHFRRQGQIMNRGWLGFENVGNGFWYNVTPNLTGAIGWILVILGAAGIAWAVWRRTRFDIIVVPYVIIYFAYIGTWKELADRYLLPIVPLVILLGIRLCIEIARLRPRARVLSVASTLVAVAVLAGALVAPLGASLSFVRDLTGADTRAVARQWIEEHIPAGSLIAAENYGPPLVRQDQLVHYRKARLDAVAYRLVRLNLPHPGTPERTRNLVRLRKLGVQYVVTSSRVQDRVLAAASEYPIIVEFYRRLDAEAELIREFRPAPRERGPVLRLYRLSGAP